MIWSRLHRTVAIFIVIFTDQTAGGGFFSRSWHTGSGESRSSTHPKLNRTARRIHGRTPRSRSDRTAIVARSSRDRGAIKPQSWLFHHGIKATRHSAWFQLNVAGENPTIVAWSPLDRDHDRMRLWLLLKLNWGRIHRKFLSYKAARRNHSHDPCKPLPRPIQSATIFGPKIPFKSMYFPSCSSTFNRFVKWIKQISRKISSSSWSPHVQTRLRSNWSWIDHEFLLDFIKFSPWIPNVHEEESEQIRFNPQELKAHSCGNWVSSEIRSIIRS